MISEDYIRLKLENSAAGLTSYESPAVIKSKPDIVKKKEVDNKKDIKSVMVEYIDKSTDLDTSLDGQKLLGHITLNWIDKWFEKIKHNYQIAIKDLERRYKECKQRSGSSEYVDCEGFYKAELAQIQMDMKTIEKKFKEIEKAKSNTVTDNVK